MRKKATLLIQHLERIYTMTPYSTSEVVNGFIAVYHDHILAIGQGDGSAYIDKDTRVIEGRSHMAIPGFIDVAFCAFTRMKHVSELYECSQILLQRGTMIVNTRLPLDQKSLAAFTSHAMVDVYQCALKEDCRMANLDERNRNPRHFCISTNILHADCLDQLLCAKLYAQMHAKTAASTILAACTVYGAHCLSIHDAGILKAGARANILLLEGNDFATVLGRFHGTERMQVIKDGVRLYPSVLI